MTLPRRRLSTRKDQVAGYCLFTRLNTDAETGRDPVVFVHGLSMSSLYFLPLARRLADHTRVYAPDLPGFGRSQKPGRILNIAEQVEVLKDWMDCFQLPRAALIGNSMGCEFIAAFGLRYPERISRAVLIGPTVDRYARTYRQQAFRAVFNMLFEPLDFWAVLLRDYLAAGLRRTFVTLGYGLNDPIEARLPHFEIPALVVRGEHDRIVSQRWAEEVTALLPDARLVIIPGGAHVANYDSAGRLTPLLLDFLSP